MPQKNPIPVREHRTINRGDDFWHPFTAPQNADGWPSDLSGWALAGQLRDDPDSPTIIATFQAFVVNGATLECRAELDKTVAALLADGGIVHVEGTAPPGDAYPGARIRLLELTCGFSPDTTYP